MEDDSTKFLRKAKENPAVPLGLTGLTGVVVYGIYKFREKKIKTSIYLIHLRLAAQGTFIGAVTLGLLYTLVQKNYEKFFNKKD